MTQHWRYYLPSEKGEGYAIIFLDSTGVFSAVSDFGNYGYVWGHHGCESIKHFLLESEKDWHYFAKKLDGTEVPDWEKTMERIKSHILTYRSEGNYTKEFARKELELLKQHNPTDQLEFHAWYLETSIQNASEMIVRRLQHSVEHFAKKTLPRLCALLKAELEAEKSLLQNKV